MQNQEMQLASLSHGVPVSLCFTSKNIPLKALNSHIISQTEQFYVYVLFELNL